MPANRLFSFAAVLFATTSLFVAGCGGGDDGDKDWQGETIKIGSIFSTTGDGAAFGPQQLKGAELAVEDINNEDDGINGAKLELVQRDDNGQPPIAMGRMIEMIKKERVLAVLGPTFSNASTEAHPLAESSKMPVLAVSNTAPGIVGDCAYPCSTIFRDSLGEAAAIPANIQTYVEADSPEGAFVIYPRDDPFGESSADTAAAAFDAMKIETRQVDYPGGMDLALDSNPGVIMVTASSGETLVQIVKDLRGNGFEGKILAGNAANSLATAEALGPDGKGLQSATAWYAGNDSEENQEFIADYKQKYGEEPDQFAAQAYTGVELLAEAIDDADLTLDNVDFENLTADREAIVRSLESVNEETPLGDFSFTEDHDVNQPIWIVEMNGKGSFDLVKELPPE